MKLSRTWMCNMDCLKWENAGWKKNFDFRLDSLDFEINMMRDMVAWCDVCKFFILEGKDNKRWKQTGKKSILFACLLFGQNNKRANCKCTRQFFGAVGQNRIWRHDPLGVVVPTVVGKRLTPVEILGAWLFFISHK